MRGKIKEHLFIKEIYEDGMNLFRNESHSGKMNGSSLKLELYERIYENKQTTIKITIRLNFYFPCAFYCLFTSRVTWKPFYRV